MKTTMKTKSTASTAIVPGSSGIACVAMITSKGACLSLHYGTNQGRASDDLPNFHAASFEAKTFEGALAKLCAMEKYRHFSGVAREAIARI
jgi:hypothetical protein